MKTSNTKLGMEMFKEIDGTTYKLCTKCLKYKPMTSKYFYKRDKVKCGFNSTCIECDKNKEKDRIRIKPFNEKGELYCQRCKTYKHISEFYENASSTKSRNYYSNNCKSCESERHRIYRETHRNDNIEIFFRDLATGCRGRAYRSEGKFNCSIDKNDLITLYEIQEHKCALSGIEMTTIKGSGQFPNNASVDRINPGKDYSIDNIRLVCNHVNMMKSNLSDEDLLNYCRCILETCNKNK